MYGTLNWDFPGKKSIVYLIKQSKGINYRTGLWNTVILIQGDFVYITDDSWSTSPEHWVSGTSWLTGQAGYLPKNFVTQMAETNTWTVHIALPLCEREILPTSIPSSTSTGKCGFMWFVKSFWFFFCLKILKA